MKPIQRIIHSYTGDNAPTIGGHGELFAITADKVNRVYWGSAPLSRRETGPTLFVAPLNKTELLFVTKRGGELLKGEPFGNRDLESVSQGGITCITEWLTEEGAFAYSEVAHPNSIVVVEGNDKRTFDLQGEVKDVALGPKGFAAVLRRDSEVILAAYDREGNKLWDRSYPGDDHSRLVHCVGDRIFLQDEVVGNCEILALEDGKVEESKPAEWLARTTNGCALVSEENEVTFYTPTSHITFNTSPFDYLSYDFSTEQLALASKETGAITLWNVASNERVESISIPPQEGVISNLLLTAGSLHLLLQSEEVVRVPTPPPAPPPEEPPPSTEPPAPATPASPPEELKPGRPLWLLIPAALLLLGSVALWRRYRSALHP
ncbi:MAG: hypothetical protein AB7F31_06560 [Parachlamydiales bacterium]